MNKLSVVCLNPVQAHTEMTTKIWPLLKSLVISGHKIVLSIKPETRSDGQNSLMWPILAEFSNQLEWPINGHMVKMDPDDWKSVLSAAFKRETVRLAMGLDGGVVMLGQRTSKFTKDEFSEFIEFLYATAAARNVRLPAWDRDQ